ncbi:MAG TPA: class I SAM-dependent methyltransferase [Mycobacterium sp.]|nr:class I SAM-dependent methyltransferase [Mycobacterium sp.]
MTADFDSDEVLSRMTDWSGEDYANISALQRTMAEEALAEAAASLRFAGNERILDVGCGDGYITRTVAGMVPDGYVVGIDPALGMLAEAARRDRSAASGPSFVPADVRRLPFSECFDAAVSFGTPLRWLQRTVHPRGPGTRCGVGCGGKAVGRPAHGHRPRVGFRHT